MTNQEQTDKIKIIEDNSPNNLSECIDMLMSALEPQNKAFIKIDGCVSLHHTIGRAIRNEWHLWNPAGKLNRWFRQELGIGHADDIITIVLDAVTAKLRNEEYSAWEASKHYKRHWYAMGVDPINQQSMTYERMVEVQKEIST